MAFWTPPFSAGGGDAFPVPLRTWRVEGRGVRASSRDPACGASGACLELEQRLASGRRPSSTVRWQTELRSVRHDAEVLRRRLVEARQEVEVVRSGVDHVADSSPPSPPPSRPTPQRIISLAGALYDTGTRAIIRKVTPRWWRASSSSRRRTRCRPSSRAVSSRSRTAHLEELQECDGAHDDRR